MIHTDSFEAKMVQRLSAPNAITAMSLSKEVGVSQSQLSRWLRMARTVAPMTKDRPSDRRGFQPEIYAVARRRHGGRFFWTTFLTNPARAYRRTEWLQEDLDALRKYRPKYVVALTHIPEGPDSIGYFEALGYKKAEGMWEFTILERTDPATSAQ